MLAKTRAYEQAESEVRKLEQVLLWVKNLTIYLILVSLLLHLVPGTAYLRYIKLFAGIVFLLLFVQPVSKGFGLEQSMAYAFERIRFSFDQKDMKRAMLGQEERRLQEIFSRYQAAVEQDLKTLAKDNGLSCSKVSVQIETDQASGDYGTLLGISVELDTDGGEGDVLAFRRKAAQCYGLSESAVRVVSQR